MNPLLSSRPARGFTLPELLVSSLLIVIVMGFLFVTVDQTRRTITGTTARIGQFQAARVAFDAMTRNLAQATLNTYWDFDVDYKTRNPIRYRRQSDLHFVVDKATAFLGTDPAKYPTDAIFFQAPLGFTTEDANPTATSGIPQRKYRALNNMLSVVGYYVKWDDDTATQPDFIKNSPTLSQKHYRYRLMEVIQPAEMNMVYNNSNYTTVEGMSVTPSSPYTNARQWVSAALGLVNMPAGMSSQWSNQKQDTSRVLAENVVALILVPKVGERDRVSPDSLNDLLGVTRLANKQAMYDSRPQIAYDAQARPRKISQVDTNVTDKLDAVEKKQLHQLPPILQVTMVAIDEDSAQQLQSYSTNPPNWTGDLFKKYSTVAAFNKELGDPVSPDANSLIYRLSNPDKTLPTPRMNYRVFTTDVIMRASKWSRNAN